MLCLASVASTVYAEMPYGYTDNTLEGALQKAEKDGVNIMIYLSFQNRCSSCSYINAHITNGEVGRAYGLFHFVYASTYPFTDKAKKIRSQFKLPSYSPQILFVDGKGREICRANKGFSNANLEALPIARAGMLSYEDAVAKAAQRGLIDLHRDCYSLMKEI